jgi:hypothetical protein
VKNVALDEIVLLEVLARAGDIAVPERLEGKVLEGTVRACQAAGWIETRPVAPGFTKLSITAAGRALADKR